MIRAALAFPLLVSLAVVGMLVSAAPARADDNSDLGLELVPWSKKVGDHRYESPRDYEGTVKFFKDKFKGYKTIRWSREVSLPAVKYIHLDNLTTNAKWEGVNIYALPDGRVRYFLLEHEAQAPAPAPAKPAG
jgi:hypothetical protein